MTAGQRGPDDEGWQPPAGQHDPAVQQPYPAAYPSPHPSPYPSPYPAAPPGWGGPHAGPPPEPQERPVAVRVAIGAFLASTILSLLASIVSLLDYDDVLDDAIDQALQDSSLSVSEVADVREFTDTFVKVGLVVGLLFIALHFLFIWFAWHGRNWARIVLWVLGGLGIVSGVVGLAAPSMGFLTGLGIFELLLTIVGVVFLAQKPANDWYRGEKERRSAVR